MHIASKCAMAVIRIAVLFALSILLLSRNQHDSVKHRWHGAASGTLRGRVHSQGSEYTRGPSHGAGNHHQHLKRAWRAPTAHKQLNLCKYPSMPSWRGLQGCRPLIDTITPGWVLLLSPFSRSASRSSVQPPSARLVLTIDLRRRWC